MTRSAPFSSHGRRIPARRYGFCFDCREDTVQWLWAVSTASPRSFRGTRVHAKYICRECGRINL